MPRNANQPQKRNTFRLEFLWAWRRFRGLSVRELGEMAGVSYVTISRLENGQEAMPSTIKKLAGALNITREQLLYTQPQLPGQEQADTGGTQKTEDAA